MNFKALAIIIFVPLAIFILAIVYKDNTLRGGNPYDQEEPEIVITNKQAVPPPQTRLDIVKDHKVILKTTEGDITIEVNPIDTPMAATNFVYLAKWGFYNDTKFHRIIKGFMIQGGSPTGDGTGGPGYTFNDEPFDYEYKRGIVAMANSGPNTNGSQFFIFHGDAPDLARDYVAFGRVVGGMDVVDKIANIPVSENDQGEMSKPERDVYIIDTEVIEE
jgi:peptidylprolyl isomerase